MPSKKGIYLFTLIGLLLGFTLDALLRHDCETLFYYAIISLFCLLYALAYDEKNPLRLIASSFLVALFLSLPLLTMKSDIQPAYIEHWFIFLCAFPVFTYVAHSFHYAYHHDNTWNIKYSSLFVAVWNTIPLLFVASVFSGLANLLILLGALIFKTVGSDYLWELYFHNNHFMLITNTVLFFIGLGVGQQNIKVINSLRFLLLRMMYYLFPVLALISIVYFILYLVHGISSGSEYINPLFILIPLVSLGILFFNAFYQDGTPEETGAPFWVKLSLKIYRIVLLLLTLMMSYRMFYEHSWDVNIAVYVLTIILFSFIYAITAFFSEDQEKQWIQKGNICIALFFIIALFLLNLPYKPIIFDVGTQTTTSQVHITY